MYRLKNCRCIFGMKYNDIQQNTTKRSNAQRVIMSTELLIQEEIPF